MISNKIIAVAVTYNPDLSLLQALLEATAPQVDEILVIDNTETENYVDFKKITQDLSKITFFANPANMGIAYAQNVGIKKAIYRGAQYVLLLDQDSVPYRDMVMNLMSHLEMFQSYDSSKVAAIAPVCIDQRNSTNLSFIASKFGFPFRLNPLKKKDSPEIFKLGFVISSGSLIDVDCIKDVGGKRSNYFIDHVDTEWCLRARAKGYVLLGSNNSFMSHAIGDEVERFKVFVSRDIPRHAPLRDYYMFRNTFLIWRDVKSFFNWRLSLIYRLLQFMVYFLIFAPDRKTRFKYMMVGIYHGLKGYSGKLDPLVWKCSSIETISIEP